MTIRPEDWLSAEVRLWIVEEMKKRNFKDAPQSPESVTASDACRFLGYIYHVEKMWSLFPWKRSI